MNRTMKAAFHTAARKLEIREVPVPTPAAGQYLVRIKACAICGSDTWWRDAPGAGDADKIHGHEAVGVVEACGKGVSRYKPGDRVVCYAIHGCGDCPACREGQPTRCPTNQYTEGGFREFSLYTEDLLFPCPDGMNWAEASLLSDAIGVPLRGLRRLPPPAGPDADKATVAVWGLGPLGLLQIMFLRAKGVKRIVTVDPLASRRAKALELGAVQAYDAETAVAAIREATGGAGADAVYTYARHAKATADIFAATRAGASICTFVGLEGEFNLPEWMERALVWSFYFVPGEYGDNVRFIRDNGIDLSAVISHRFPLERIDEAFKLRFDDPEHSNKIVVTME